LRIADEDGGNSLRALAARFSRHAQQSDRVRSLSIEILNLKAGAAAARIHQFFKESKIGLAGRRSCRGPRAPSISESSTDRMCRAGCRRSPSYRSLIQPAKEQLRQSKLTTAGIGSDTDFSHATKFAEAMAHKVYYGPVYFRRESEPYITLASPGPAETLA
jgi:two-component system, NtrC family, sensor kinase